MNYIKVNQFGIVVGGGRCQDSELSNIPMSVGETVIAGIEPPGYSTVWRYVDDALVDTGQPFLPPQPWLTWSNDTFQWVDARNLEQLRAAKWNQIKAARDAAEFGGFTWDGSAFDSDLTSQSRIQGAAQLAALAPTTFSIDWTLADNSVRTLNAAQMTAVGEALGAHVATQHAIGRTLRTAIEAATTPGELDAIAWPA